MSIIILLQLLDICRRLDALEANGFPDAVEEAEVTALRVLINVRKCLANYGVHCFVVVVVADCMAEVTRTEQNIKKIAKRTQCSVGYGLSTVLSVGYGLLPVNAPVCRIKVAVLHA